MSQITDLELEEIQKKTLGILLVFQEFCKKHNLMFYLCGGGCIGAVRHKGFIPWDDDLDVFMPRQDFEKLALLWPSEMACTQYTFCRTTYECYTRYLMSAISDSSTTFIKERQKDLDIDHGLRLDIIPLDGRPEGILKKIFQIGWALVRQVYINQEPLTSGGKIPYCLSKMMLALIPRWNMRYRIAMIAEKQMTKYPFGSTSKVTELCARFEPMLRDYPYEAFEKEMYLMFEGKRVPVPVGYETYLKMAFGDYMQLPPEEKRVPPHDVVKVDLENSYKKYKGIYYCTH